MTPDRDELREKVARALAASNGIDVDGPNWEYVLQDADAVLAVLPQYEQVGYHVTFPPFADGTANTMLWATLAAQPKDGEKWVPVYIVREDTDE